MTKLTVERLLYLLSYDPKTGVFRRLVVNTNANKVGEEAGGLGDKGYRYIMVDGIRYSAHRLAWFYVNGVWPVGEIDHRNRIRDDNRIKNLRDATRFQNMQNTVFAGVGFHKASGKFRARIQVNGKKMNLGLFKTREAARAAYLEAKRKYHIGATQ